MKPNFLPISFSATLLAVFCNISVAAVAQTETPAPAPESAAVLHNDPLHVFSQSVQALTAKVTKSVVQIVATGYGFNSEKTPTIQRCSNHRRPSASGVILSSDGYIVTNAHVVQGARRIRVRLPGLERPGPDDSNRTVR